MGRARDREMEFLKHYIERLSFIAYYLKLLSIQAGAMFSSDQ